MSVACRGGWLNAAVSSLGIRGPAWLNAGCRAGSFPDGAGGLATGGSEQVQTICGGWYQVSAVRLAWRWPPWRQCGRGDGELPRLRAEMAFQVVPHYPASASQEGSRGCPRDLIDIHAAGLRHRRHASALQRRAVHRLRPAAGSRTRGPRLRRRCRRLDRWGDVVFSDFGLGSADVVVLREAFAT